MTKKRKLPSPRDKDCDNSRLCLSACAMHLQHSSALWKQSSEDFVRGLLRSFEEHLKNIRRVLQKPKEANLKLSPSMCHLFWREVTYLGHFISSKGDSDKISAVKDWNCRLMFITSGVSWNYARITENSSKISQKSADHSIS
ncbi:hypothetical protein TNCV_1501931 [Trichonephila clavipes]|uniref:Uncharacterized protein n=1 Tax=Trichonephila clavipes TaxID=2585209 RepID=A0A8X6RQD6_TRICX|nr:hypothetical protein TNCV_1501931 [Trichonephila clavipes]